jgi:hypothetical protein
MVKHTDLLDSDSGIDTGYRHRSKGVAAGEPLELDGTLLKWYDLGSADQPVAGEISRMARAYLSKTPLEARGMGFVVLHRCGGAGFYFLIVSTWRNNNEIWESVFYKDGDAMVDFAPFARDGAHKPTFCVWELVPVWHEQQAWVRFLESARDEPAAARWLADCYTGPA